MSAISAWIKNKKTKVISTFEYLLSDCVVLALLDVGVELPGENHHVLFHLQETQDSRVKTVYLHIMKFTREATVRFIQGQGEREGVAQRLLPHTGS